MGEFLLLVLIGLLVACGVGAAKTHDTITTTVKRADGKTTVFETKVPKK